MLIQQIRSASTTEHEKLEKNLFPYLSDIKTKDDYRLLLQAFYGYIMPVQELIFSHVDHERIPDLGQRRNADLILKDLRDLGDMQEPTLCGHLPAINSHAAALGALYVLEGSTLGGKIIAKMITEKLHGTSALRFFKGYEENTGTMWKSFLGVLERNDDPKHNNVIVESARDTFTLFDKWLNLNLERND